MARPAIPAWRWLLPLVASLVAVACAPATCLAQAGGEGGSIGGSIAPPPAAHGRPPLRARPRPPAPHPKARATRRPSGRLSPAEPVTATCSLRMERTQNPDGSACAMVVGYSQGVRVGPFHTSDGQHIGTCEGFLPAISVRGNKLGYPGHMRVLSDDCHSSTGY